MEITINYIHFRMENQYAKEHSVCPDCSFCLDLEEAFSVGRMLFSDNE